MDLRAIGWVAAGVVLGFVVGGIPKQYEVRALREENHQLRRELEDAAQPSLLQRLLPQMGGIREVERGSDQDLRGDASADASSGRGAERAPRFGDARPEGPTGDVAVIGERPGAGVQGVPERGQDRGSGPVDDSAGDDSTLSDSERDARRTERRRERTMEALRDFDRIASAQRARTAALRASLIQQAKLSPEQVDELDSATSRMNEKLTGYGEEIVDQAVTQDRPRPEAALGLGHDVSGILLEGQREVDAIVGETESEVDPAAREVWNYVDLGQWQPFVEKRLAQTEQGSARKEAAAAADAAGRGAVDESER